jgi:hypothetical protein
MNDILYLAGNVNQPNLNRVIIKCGDGMLRDWGGGSYADTEHFGGDPQKLADGQRAPCDPNFNSAFSLLTYDPDEPPMVRDHGKFAIIYLCDNINDASVNDQDTFGNVDWSQKPIPDLQKVKTLTILHEAMHCVNWFGCK